MSNISNMVDFERAICEALGIDVDKEKVLAIDIAIRPKEVVTVTTTHMLLTNEAEQLTRVLRGVKWEMVEEDKG